MPFLRYRAKLSALNNILALGNNHKLTYHSRILQIQVMNIGRSLSSRASNQAGTDFIDFI